MVDGGKSLHVWDGGGKLTIWKSAAAEAKHGMKIERITVQKDSITYQTVS